MAAATTARDPAVGGGRVVGGGKGAGARLPLLFASMRWKALLIEVLYVSSRSLIACVPRSSRLWSWRRQRRSGGRGRLTARAEVSVKTLMPHLACSSASWRSFASI